MLQRFIPALDRALSQHSTATLLCLAQVPHLAEPDAVALFRALVARDSSITVGADALARWPALARDAAITHALSLPKGRARIEAMLSLEALLPEAHRAEALEGIFDGTAPEYEFISKPMSFLSLHEAFVQTLDAASKERWIAFRRSQFRDPLGVEMLARNAVDHWPADAITRCWNALTTRASPICALPSESIYIYRALPPHLLAEALSILRERASINERRFAFGAIPTAVLSDEEREDTVAVPSNPYTREDDRVFAQHLRYVQRHVSRVSSALKSQIIQRAFSLREPYDRHCALAHLVRVVDATDRPRINEELARLTVSEAFWPTYEERFEFFDAPTLARLVRDPAMLRCPFVLEDFVREALRREHNEQDTIIEAALDNVIQLALEESAIEPLCAASAWLSRQSDGEIPRWIATHTTGR